MAKRPDIYTRVTAKIIADLEAGTQPWHKPWNTEHLAGRVSRPLRHNGVAYRGLNIVLLWVASVAKGFAAPTWMTYRQASELGGQVRKGAKGELVVYADTFRKTETDAAGQDREVAIPFMKGYTVFNVDQIEGLPAAFYAVPEPILDTIARDAAADSFFGATGADIRHGGAQAYYATLGHEITHWTRHPDRLDRSFGRKRWGDEGYAQEELVAELGAAFLAADLGLSPDPRPEHAAYIDHYRSLASWSSERHAIYLPGRDPCAACSRFSA